MGLIAWYKLDGDALDSHKNDLHGAPANMTYENGLIGQDGRFNGTSGYIRINDVPAYLVARSYSISAWIKTDGAVTGNEIVAINNTTGTVNRALWRIVTGGVIDMYITDGFKGGGSAVVNDSVWHHVCYTFDYDANEIRAYVDGSVDRIYTSFTLAIDATDHMHIGMETDDPDTPSDWFDGWMNDIRIYDHVLSVKEVKELSRCLVVHYEYSLDRDQSGEVVPDSSDYGFHGTIDSGVQPTWAYDNSVPKGIGSYIFESPDKDVFTITPTFLNRTTDADFTAMAWFRVEVMPTGTTPIGIGMTPSVSGNGLFIYYNGTWGLWLWLNSASTLYRVMSLTDSTATGVYDGKWHHVAWAFKEPSTMEIYVDAVLVSGGANDASVGSGDFALPAGFSTLNIGAFDSASAGKVHQTDLRWYARYLQPKDIQEIYQASASIDNKGNLWC
jgi:hypothetical protein